MLSTFSIVLIINSLICIEKIPFTLASMVLVFVQSIQNNQQTIL